MHLLRLMFRFQLSSGKTILSAAFRVKLESAMQPVQRAGSDLRRADSGNIRLAVAKVAVAASRLRSTSSIERRTACSRKLSELSGLPRRSLARRRVGRWTFAPRLSSRLSQVPAEVVSTSVKAA
jgi:hypothetical protein